MAILSEASNNLNTKQKIILCKIIIIVEGIKNVCVIPRLYGFEVLSHCKKINFDKL